MPPAPAWGRTVAPPWRPKFTQPEWSQAFSGVIDPRGAQAFDRERRADHDRSLATAAPEAQVQLLLPVDFIRPARDAIDLPAG